MVYPILTELLKKHLFFIFSEKFKSESSETVLERSLAKHFLLKPELIVINDQIHGFKKISEKFKSLERFPIFIEIEYVQSSDDEKWVENIDLYCETTFQSPEKLADVAYLAQLYEKNILVERISHLNAEEPDTLLVYSKMGSIFSDGYVEEDLEDGFTNETELTLKFEVSLISFVNFIKLLDDILNKGKSAHHITTIFNSPIKDDKDE